jgi:hypothetical protein
MGMLLTDLQEQLAHIAGQDQPFLSLNCVGGNVAFARKPTMKSFGAASLPSLAMRLVKLRKTSKARFMAPVQEAQ